MPKSRSTLPNKPPTYCQLCGQKSDDLRPTPKKFNGRLVPMTIQVCPDCQ